MELNYSIHCIWALTLIIQCSLVNTIIPTDHRELSRNLTAYLDYLLDGYNKIIRPGYGGPPVIVTVLMNIRSMGSISETDESYSMDCYFRQTWVDPRLKYSIKGLNEITLPWLFLKRIWKPDTFFINGMKSHLHRITVPNVFVRLRQDGHIIYSQRLTVKAICPMHLRKFPLDSQKCPLLISSYGYNMNNLIYKWMHNSSEKSVEVSDSLEIAQYDLEQRTIKDTSIPRGIPIMDCYSMIQVTFHLKRQNGYYMLQVYVPCALIVMCSWISFWIDPDDVPARVMLGVTTALSMTTMGFGGKGQMPRVSYPTALDYFVILCFSFIFAVMIEYATINFKDRIRKELKKKLQDEEAAAAAASANATPSANAMPQKQTTEITNADKESGDPNSGETLEIPKSRQRSVSMVDFPVSKSTLEVPTASSTRRRRKSDVHSRSSRDNLSRTGIKTNYTRHEDSTTSGVWSPIIKTLGHIPQVFKKKRVSVSAGNDPKQVPMITITRKRSASNVSDIDFDDNISENMYEVLPGDDMFYDDFSDDDEAASSIDDDRTSQLSIMIGEFASTTRRSVKRCLMKPVKIWKGAKFLPSEEEVFRQLKNKEPAAKFTNVDIQSRKFFPLAFVIFLTVYWVLYLYILADESAEDKIHNHKRIPYFAKHGIKSPPISPKI